MDKLYKKNTNPPCMLLSNKTKTIPHVSFNVGYPYTVATSDFLVEMSFSAIFHQEFL